MPYNLFSRKECNIIVHHNTTEIEDKSFLLWCDLYNIERTEENWIEGILGIEVPTRDEMHEIEPSSRFYVEKGTIYATISIVTKSDTPEPEIHAVSFIILEKTLVTLRYCDPYSFAQFAKHLKEDSTKYQCGFSLAIGLVDETINRLADIIENSGHILDNLNRKLFRPSVVDKKLRQQSMPDFEEMLRQIGIQADLLSKVRESLLSIERMTGFIHTTANTSIYGSITAEIEIIEKDTSSLVDQVDSLSGKAGFLLEAALGLVGLQQTSIIKIFSVAAVVFLPPTLIASIYGMNFNFMPELGWKFGYPLAIVLMLASAWMPYQFFKKKKWL